LSSPQFIVSTDGTFAFHDQDFIFGAQELAGLKIFLAEPVSIPVNSTNLVSGRIGNCIACHAPPAFTDFQFHNTGMAQEEYDRIHGGNAFAAIAVPDAKTRRANFNVWLPATVKHPSALGPFFEIPSTNQIGYTDLGLWNVYDNPDVPRPQARLRRLLKSICDDRKCTRDELLPLTNGLFKTPGLRDLADSQPYLHNGSKDTFEDVIQFYIDQSALARAGQLRNGDARMQGVALSTNDINALSAFLESLTEDYH
jgi:cytochrome c peroxidase